MGVTFENLTLEELCNLMCGDPEPEEDEEWEEEGQVRECGLVLRSMKI